MKKFTSMLLIFIMIFSVSFSEEMTPGEKLQELGLVQGDETGDLMEDESLTRAQMAVMLARLNGVEEQAQNFDGEQPFNDSQDHWARNYIGYAYQQGWTKGIGGNQYGPEAQLTEQMVATFMLRILGYEDNWDTAIEDAAALGIVNNTDGEFLRKNAFDMMHDAVYTTMANNEQLLGEHLGVLDEASPVTIKSVNSLSNKTLEVTIESAVPMVNENVFTVTDESNNVLAIDHVKFAGWDNDQLTVLIWLEDAVQPGNLYTLTSGDSSKEFGGKSVETEKPYIINAEATEYNAVEITFNEPIQLDTMKVKINEKYGDLEPLDVLSLEYIDKNKILVTTEEQVDGEIYRLEVSEAQDFFGNTMTTDGSQTLLGVEKPTETLKISTLKVEDYNKVIVLFRNDLKVDPTTVVPENFRITERNDEDESLAILDAEVIKDASNYDDLSTSNEGSAVVLTTDPQQRSVIYTLIAENLKSKYGTNLDSNYNDGSFSGIAKPEDGLDVVDVSAISNKLVKITFERKINEATVDLSDFSVNKTYESQTALNVTDFKVDGDVITLTTNAQTASTLYDLAINDLEDIYGNTIDTQNNLESFVGKAVSPKITKITSISLTNDTELKITFDQNIGSNATDIGMYQINGDVGYPESVEKTGDRSVKLVIPKTIEGKLYTLTVKAGLMNSDEMATTETLTKTFVGSGKAAVKPRLKSAIALNNQTVQLTFSSSVKDVDGLINESNEVIADAIEYGVISRPNTDFDYGFINPDDPTVMTVYTFNDNAFVTGNSQFMFYISADGSDAIDSDYDQVQMAANEDEPEYIAIDDIVATSRDTLNVFFNQSVRHIDVEDVDNATFDEFAYVDINGNGTYDDTIDGDIVAARAVNKAKTQWELRINQSLDNEIYDLNINPAVDGNSISNVTMGQTVAVLDPAVRSIEFAGTDTSIDYIDDVSAVMTDAKTIRVDFPEAMDESSVENIGNYAIKNDPDSEIVDVTYYETDEAFYAELVINNSIDNAIDSLVISNDSIMNALGNKAVETEMGEDLEIMFARSTKTPEGIQLEDASTNLVDNTMTIDFSQKFFTTTNLDGDVEMLLDILDLTINEGNTVDASDIDTVDTKLDKVDVPDSTAYYTNRLIITFDTTLEDNQQATITFDDPIIEELLGVKGQPQDVESDLLIVQ